MLHSLHPFIIDFVIHSGKVRLLVEAHPLATNVREMEWKNEKELSKQLSDA